jgi:hypothetical protein
LAGNYSDPLFLGAAPGGFTAQEFTKLGGFVGTSGVSSLNDLTPSGTGTTMTFTAGRAIIQGTDVTTQGHYLCRLTATQTYTLPGGVASSGHERTDWLVAKVYDDPIAIVAGGSNEWKIIAVTGTEAVTGSSVAPSLSLTVSSYIPIATVKVNSSGIVSITDAAGAVEPSEPARHVRRPSVPRHDDGEPDGHRIQKVHWRHPTRERPDGSAATRISSRHGRPRTAWRTLPSPPTTSPSVEVQLHQRHRLR